MIQVVGRCTISGGAGIVGIVSIESNGDVNPRGTVEIIGDLAPQLYPTAAGTKVRPAMEFQVNGVKVSSDWIVGQMSYSASLDNFMASAGFTLRVTDGAGLFGNPQDYHGPPFGTAPIDVYGVYRTAQGERRLPLIKNGIAHQIARSGNREAGFVESWTIVDGAGRIDARTVTLTRPPGHGFTRGRVVQLLFQQIGISLFRLEPGAPMYKEIPFVGADPFRSAQAIEEVEGRTVYFDNEGFLVNPVIGDVRDLPTKWNWTEDDIVSVEQLNATIPGDVLTEVTLTGSEQVLRELSDANLVDTQISPPTLIIEDHIPVLPVFRQNSGCSLTTLTPALSARETVISSTVSTVTSKGGVQVFNGTEVESFKYPEAARYQYAAAGVRNCIANVYLLEEGAEAEDSTAAFAGTSEFWALTDKQTTRTYYDAVGYTGPIAHSTAEPWGKKLQGAAISTRRKLGSISEEFGWYIRRAALKARVAGTPFEELDPITGTKTLGNGEGVTDEQETYMLIGREVQVVDVRTDLYIKAVTTYRMGWAFDPGGEFQLAGGELVGSQFESFRLKQTETVVYVPLRNGELHAIIKTVIEHVGDGRRSPITEITFEAGDAPAVERLPDNDLDPDDYETPEEFEAARIARLYETRPIKGIFTSAALEAIHPRRVQEQSSDFAENPEELFQMARRAVERTAALPLSFAISVNFAVKRGDKAHVKHSHIGWDYDVQVHSVDHQVNPAENEPNAASLTRLVCKKYPTLN